MPDAASGLSAAGYSGLFAIMSQGISATPLHRRLWREISTPDWNFGVAEG
jgi:hypothetical protein